MDDFFLAGDIIEEDSDEPSDQLPDVKMPNFFDNMPTDCIAEIFSKLEREDVNSFKLSCHLMRSVFKRYRSIIDGPLCNAWVNYDKCILTFKIQIIASNRNRKIQIVSFNEWKQYFQNANCLSMYIQTDTDIPVCLLDRIFCCSYIDFLTYKGDTINKKTLEKLNSIARDPMDLTVNRWISGMTGCSWLTSVDVIGDNTSFEELIELIKWVSSIYLKIKPKKFEESIKTLKKLKTGDIDIEQWNLSVPDEHDGEFTDEMVSQFMAELERISGIKLWRFYGNTSLRLGSYPPHIYPY